MFFFILRLDIKADTLIAIYPYIKQPLLVCAEYKLFNFMFHSQQI